MKLGNDLLEVENDLSDVLFDSGDGGKLVLNTGDLNRGDSSAFKRREQNSSHGVAQSSAVTALERFNNKLAVGAVFGNFHALYCRIDKFCHENPPFQSPDVPASVACL